MIAFIILSCFLTLFIHLLFEYRYPNLTSVIKLKLFRAIDSFGIQFHKNIYTINGMIYLFQENLFPYNIILFENNPDHVLLYWSLFKINSLPIKIDKTYIEPGYSLIYKVDGNQIPISNYIDGVPYRVDKGELILRKRIPKSLGIRYTNIAIGTEWPLEKIKEL